VIAAALAVALQEANTPQFAQYIANVKENAHVLAAALMNQGFSVVTNGTDNHLVLWDVRNTGLDGAKVEKLLDLCGISVNKNSIVGDTSAVIPGGVRLGTLAVTTRGMIGPDMHYIASVIARIVQVGRRVEEALQRERNLHGVILSKSSGTAAQKFKEFVEKCTSSSEEFAGQLSSIEEEIKQFSSKFYMPGKAIA
jgi:glycine hydroxymethyltransferase